MFNLNPEAPEFAPLLSDFTQVNYNKFTILDVKIVYFKDALEFI